MEEAGTWKHGRTDRDGTAVGDKYQVDYYGVGSVACPHQSQNESRHPLTRGLSKVALNETLISIYGVTFDEHCVEHLSLGTDEAQVRD